MLAKPSKRLWAYASIFAIPTAIATSFGVSYTLRETSGIGSKLTTALFLLATCICLTLFVLSLRPDPPLIKLNRREKSTPQEAKGAFQKIFIVLLLAWLPYYLASFPGLYVYDAIPQTMRAISLGIIDTWHPLLHTWWMSGCMMLGNALFGSYQIGFAAYTTTQYLLYAALLAFFAKKLPEASGLHSASKLCTIFFALFPVFPIMAVSSTKDTIFSASFALFAILAYSLSKNQILKASDKSMLFLSAFLLSCFRNNGYYALLLTVAAILVLKMSRQIGWRKWILLICVCGVAAIAIPKAISERSSNASEVLGVPIQQVSRVASRHSSELTKSEIDELNRVIPAWSNYNPNISDSVKFINGTGETISKNLGAFLSLWLKYLARYPGEYIDAVFGMINPWINPFSSVPTLAIDHPYLEYDSYEIYDSTTLTRHWPTQDDFMPYDIANVIEIHRTSLFPWFAKYMRAICYNPPWYTYRPIGIITSVGLLIQIGFYAIVASGYKREKTNAITFIFMGGYFLTCLLGPAFLIRYALPFYVVAPLVLSIVFKIVVWEDR